MSKDIEPEQARQGRKTHTVRYVLAASLGLAVVALVLVVIFAV